jgi:hypothetical protein
VNNRNRLPGSVQAEDVVQNWYFTDAKNISGAQYITDIYPLLVRKATFLVVGESTVHSDRATAYIDGDLVDYRYPFKVLDQNKNLVFTNGSTEIYK